MIRLNISINGHERVITSLKKIEFGLSGVALGAVLKTSVVPFLQRISLQSWPSGRVQKWDDRVSDKDGGSLMNLTENLKDAIGGARGETTFSTMFAQLKWPSDSDVDVPSEKGWGGEFRYYFHQAGTSHFPARPMVGLLPEDEGSIYALIDRYVASLV